MPSNASGPNSGATSDDKATPAETPQKSKGSPYDYVRVIDESGTESSVLRAFADSADTLKILNGKPALDGRDRPLPTRMKSENHTDKAGAPVQEA